MTGRIFVYGSLMTGFFNYNKILKGKVLQSERAYVIGTLYHLKGKGYPGFVTKGDTKVYGEILTIHHKNELIEEMDLLEGFHGFCCPENEYHRMALPVTSVVTQETVELELYVYNPMAFNNYFDERIRIQEGCWRSYMSSQKKK